LQQAKLFLPGGLQLPKLTRRLFVGIDWGSETHHVCVVNSDAQIIGDRKVRQSAEGLADFVQWLSVFRADSVTSVVIAIEVPHGAVVEVLVEHGFEVFSINPKQPFS
jgi:hypothetical protein